MNQRILLADDSLTIQKVVELTFMDESFDVEAVGSGDEAIASLEREVPSVLIADVHMPGSSGYEVCRRAKELDPNLPVLLLVGTFEALDEDEIVACGADGNLKKPFDSQELLQIVKDMVASAAPTAAGGETQVVEGLETTSLDDGDSQTSEAAATPTGFETTVFNLDPQPGDEPEFVPSAGFDMGRDEEEEAGDAATPAMEAEAEETADEPAVVPVATAPEDPMDDLLGALDEVEARSATTEEPAIDAEEERPAAEEAPSEAPSEPPAASVSGGDGMAEADLERVARRVVELMSEQAVREVAWEVIPDLAEIVIKERIRELEAEAE